jgi:lysozyme
MKWLLALIRKFEGCRLKAYLCPAGVWTIGWGATGPGIKKGVEWKQWEADARLKKDAMVYWLAAVKLSPILAGNKCKHAAIADFCYNLGSSRYKASTLKKRVDEEDWEEAVYEIQRWVYGGGRKLRGLVIRRKAEAALLEVECE